MQKLTCFIGLFFLMALQFSCTRPEDCINTNFAFKFIGFDSASLSDVRIYKYNIGDSFSNKLDSIQAGIGNLTFGQWDSGILHTSHYVHTGYINIIAGFEWQVCVMSTGNTYSLKDLNFQSRKDKMYKPGCPCINNGSFMFNDTVYYITGNLYDCDGKEVRLYR